MAREVILSDHARWRLALRKLAEEVVLRIAREPEQVIPIRFGREIRQARLALPPEGRMVLVRAIVDAGEERDVVVTAYQTSKVDKYWRKP